jgi:hypothetical protein
MMVLLFGQQGYSGHKRKGFAKVRKRKRARELILIFLPHTKYDLSVLTSARR